MVWRGTELAHEAIKHGYDVVMSPGAYCYFDMYQDAPGTQPVAYAGATPTESSASFQNKLFKTTIDGGVPAFHFCNVSAAFI